MSFWPRSQTSACFSRYRLRVSGSGAGRVSYACASSSQGVSKAVANGRRRDVAGGGAGGTPNRLCGGGGGVRSASSANSMSSTSSSSRTPEDSVSTASPMTAASSTSTVASSSASSSSSSSSFSWFSWPGRSWYASALPLVAVNVPVGGSGGALRPCRLRRAARGHPWRHRHHRRPRRRGCPRPCPRRTRRRRRAHGRASVLPDRRSSARPWGGPESSRRPLAPSPSSGSAHPMVARSNSSLHSAAEPFVKPCAKSGPNRALASVW